MDPSGVPKMLVTKENKHFAFEEKTFGNGPHVCTLSGQTSLLEAATDAVH